MREVDRISSTSTTSGRAEARDDDREGPPDRVPDGHGATRRAAALPTSRRPRRLADSVSSPVDLAP